MALFICLIFDFNKSKTQMFTFWNKIRQHIANSVIFYGAGYELLCLFLPLYFDV
jgi:hypothetical protein